MITTEANRIDSRATGYRHASRAGQARQLRPADGILDCVGGTPLVRFRRYLDEDSVELYAKLESSNPGGSAKDRPALRMLTHAMKTGRLRKGDTVIESSSGNMGIGLSQACRFHGLNFICVVDPNAQSQNVAIMKAYGANVVRVTEPVDGSFLGARLKRVNELLEQISGSYWPNQYANRQNPISHQTGTIREIDQALEGDIDYLFVATSSTGTAQGCRDYLRQMGRETKVVAVDANGSVLFGGSPGKRLIPGLGAGHEPALAREQSFDDVVRVSDLDCVVGCRRAAEREAVLVGGSAGGVLEVVRSLQLQLQGKKCAAILHDSGTRYLDTVYNNGWVEESLGVSADVLEKRIDSPALPAKQEAQP
ncbi:2,3-diaminopropionate biosynthesis protein SbnA [Mariniblastus fucicola]|uniref:N-(2-amino-2-carboxyethyl)-L-glutamate synthase n=1 Tax=Mariniblastus fucicola TaxID=980251 RepID=A0A5B9PFA0_9BACT|nr:2,3-diaminopropionate biosynthesis protein SbnA [Mariniblastus fucicola]QEG23860.1 putative siderophore biosynthesis protein SbnA [Mariniblastus fucicola]